MPEGDEWEFDGTETEFAPGEQVNLKYKGTKFVAKIELVALPTRITVTPATLTLAVGKTMSLTAEIYPDNAENKNVTWVSDNISVATVDATTSLTTTVTAVAPGTATITVTTEENNKSAEITVIVISGKFSVSGTKQVVFSPGNLQYNTGTNEWRFAPHQYDICHVDGDKVGEDYEDWKKDSKWTDLFGWGMWLSSNGENDDISPTKTLFSQSNYLSSVTSGEFSGTSAIGSEWENLTKAELGYLFNYRSYANGTRANKYGVGTIHSILGVILLPDDYEASSGIVTAFVPGAINTTYSDGDWEKMEVAGAVFLPPAGYRRGTDVYDHSDRGRCGRYWVSSAYDKFSTYGLHFDASFVNPNFADSRYIGSAVRLVREVNE